MKAGIAGGSFFEVMGLRPVVGRLLTAADDHPKSAPVAVLTHRFWKNTLGGEPVLGRSLRLGGGTATIVGVVADVDDENVVPGPALTIYHPVPQVMVAGRLFVHAAGDPYALVPEVTRVIHELAPETPVERAATLEDVRAQVLAPDRLNAFVISGFAGVALLVALVGVAGVLAFSVSARTRELGVRLAIGSTPGQLVAGVVGEGARIVGIGILVGAAGGYLFSSVAGRVLEHARLPGALPVLAAAGLLAAAGVLASLMPAARAAHVDVVRALRSE